MLSIFRKISAKFVMLWNNAVCVIIKSQGYIGPALLRPTTKQMARTRGNTSISGYTQIDFLLKLSIKYLYFKAQSDLNRLVCKSVCICVCIYDCMSDNTVQRLSLLGAPIGSETSQWPLMSVCRSVGRLVSRSVSLFHIQDPLVLPFRYTCFMVTHRLAFWTC